MKEIDQHSYSKYSSEQRETQAIESRLERVKKLLEKLPESERTVITLYYLGEMTTREISRFLGVSVNTIKSRLRRARMRLQEENPQQLEIFSTVKFSTSLTDSIMQQVADIKQTPTPIGKPSPPWAVFGTAAAILIMAIIGISNQHLFSFQEPYSLDAQSEPTIEIVDAPNVLDTDIKRTAQNQPRRIGAIEIAQDGTKQTTTKDKTPVNLDLDAILAGIKQNDEAVKSGEGKCVYTYESFAKVGDPRKVRMTLKAHLVFDEHQNRVRLELNDIVSQQNIGIPKGTTIVTEKGTLSIEHLRNGHEPVENGIRISIIVVPKNGHEPVENRPRYRFEKITRLKWSKNHVAPRRWTRLTDTEDLSTSLKDFNYQILTRDIVDGIPCYVLETKGELPSTEDQQMTGTSRIWIAAEHGFRIQKLERRWTTEEDTSRVARHTYSYQQIGDVWFLKSAKRELAQVDSEGKEHIFLQMTLELQDFKINHAVPPETFTYDIPDDAKITVEGFDEKMSKQAFLEWYEQK